MTEKHSFQWITETSRLSELCNQWSQQATLFIDTEFHRETTFYPQLALLQIYDGSEAYLIEPDAADNNAQFLALLTSDSTRKVFHSPSEDCEVLYRRYNKRIAGLFDTQIAAAIAGLGGQLSYAQLVEHACQKQLEKGLSRTDWLQRPLAENQLQYAVDDVVYLAQAYQWLLQRLSPEKLGWVLEDSEQLARRVDSLDEFEFAYLDVKNGWQLNEKQLSSLYYLTQWREIRARELNVPKSFIANNDVMFELAKQGLNASGRLPNIQRWHPVAKRKYGASITQILEHAESGELVFKELIKPLSPAFWHKITREMQLARDEVTLISEKYSIDVDVLCSKKLMRGYVKWILNKAPEPPRGWTQWRESLLGDPIRRIFCDNTPS